MSVAYSEPEKILLVLIHSVDKNRLQYASPALIWQNIISALFQLLLQALVFIWISKWSFLSLSKNDSIYNSSYTSSMITNIQILDVYVKSINNLCA